MKVLFLQQGDLCIRTYKEAIALAKNSILDISLYCGKINEYFETKNFRFVSDEFIEEMNIHSAKIKLYNIIKEINPDIIHTHNPPDWYVKFIKEKFKEIYLVHDIHDIYTTEGVFYCDIPEALKYADAIITVSEKCKEIFSKMTLADIYIIPSGSISDLTLQPNKYSSYDSRIHAAYVSSFYHFEDIKPIIDKLYQRLKGKVIIHLYCNTDNFVNDIKKEIANKEGIILENKIHDFNQLSNVISRNDLGLLTEYYRQDELLMPNKLFDYGAAKLPILTYENEYQKDMFKDWIKFYDDWNGSVWTPKENIRFMMKDYVNDILNIYNNLIKINENNRYATVLHKEINQSKLFIGKDCCIDKSCVIDITSDIKIGNFVNIEQDVLIYTHEHKFDTKNPLLEHWNKKENTIFRSKKICDDVYVGAKSIILMKCNYIAKGVVILPGSVINESIFEEYSIWSGNPAKKIGKR